jgi:hypothetical protein
LAEQIRRDIDDLEVKLIEGRAGIFLVRFGDKTLWDKYAENDQFPPEGFIVDRLQNLL